MENDSAGRRSRQYSEVHQGAAVKADAGKKRWALQEYVGIAGTTSKSLQIQAQMHSHLHLGLKGCEGKK